MLVYLKESEVKISLFHNDPIYILMIGKSYN